LERQLRAAAAAAAAATTPPPPPPAPAAAQPETPSAFSRQSSGAGRQQGSWRAESAAAAVAGGPPRSASGRERPVREATAKALPTLFDLQRSGEAPLPPPPAEAEMLSPPRQSSGSKLQPSPSSSGRAPPPPPPPTATVSSLLTTCAEVERLRPFASAANLAGYDELRDALRAAAGAGGEETGAAASELRCARAALLRRSAAARAAHGIFAPLQRIFLALVSCLLALSVPSACPGGGRCDWAAAAAAAAAAPFGRFALALNALTLAAVLAAEAAVALRERTLETAFAFDPALPAAHLLLPPAAAAGGRGRRPPPRAPLMSHPGLSRRVAHQTANAARLATLACVLVVANGVASAALLFAPGRSGGARTWTVLLTNASLLAPRLSRFASVCGAAAAAGRGAPLQSAAVQLPLYYNALCDAYPSSPAAARAEAALGAREAAEEAELLAEAAARRGLRADVRKGARREKGGCLPDPEMGCLGCIAEEPRGRGERYGRME